MPDDAHDGTVLVALCRLPDGDPRSRIARGLDRLPRLMHDPIGRYRLAGDRLARIASRLLLRSLLLSLGLRIHAELDGWRRTPAGRPFLAGCEADFSLSHSGDWVAAALGVGLRLGLDIERARPLHAADFAAYFTAEEQARIAAAADPDRAILRCWCRREAVLKADGSGLPASEETIRAIGSGRYPNGRDWRVESRDLDPGCLALAVDKPPDAIALRWLDLDDLLAGNPAPQGA